MTYISVPNHRVSHGKFIGIQGRPQTLMIKFIDINKDANTEHPSITRPNHNLVLQKR